MADKPTKRGFRRSPRGVSPKRFNEAMSRRREQYARLKERVIRIETLVGIKYPPGKKEKS